MLTSDMAEIYSSATRSVDPSRTDRQVDSAATARHDGTYASPPRARGPSLVRAGDGRGRPPRSPVRLRRAPSARCSSSIRRTVVPRSRSRPTTGTTPGPPRSASSPASISSGMARRSPPSRSTSRIPRILTYCSASHTFKAAPSTTVGAHTVTASACYVDGNRVRQCPRTGRDSGDLHRGADADAQGGTGQRPGPGRLHGDLRDRPERRAASARRSSPGMATRSAGRSRSTRRRARPSSMRPRRRSRTTRARTGSRPKPARASRCIPSTRARRDIHGARPETDRDPEPDAARRSRRRCRRRRIAPSASPSVAPSPSPSASASSSPSPAASATPARRRLRPRPPRRPRPRAPSSLP